MTDLLPHDDPDVEAATLDQGQDHRRGRLDWHDVRLRWTAVVLATTLIVALGALEIHIVGRLSDTAAADSHAFVILAISPIVSAAFIVVFVLIGVFRGYRERDMDRLPVQTAARSVTQPES